MSYPVSYPMLPSRAGSCEGLPRRGQVAIVVAAALGCGGCYNEYLIPDAQVPRLDGYCAYPPAGPPPAQSPHAPLCPDADVTAVPLTRGLVAFDGTPIEFSVNTPLSIRLLDGTVVEGRLVAVRVDARTLVADRLRGGRLEIRLSSISRVTAEVYSPGQTAALAVGSVLGSGALTFATVIGSFVVAFVISCGHGPC